MIGLALVGLGFNQWRKRPDPNAKPKESGLLKRLDTMLSSSELLTPLRALGLAIVMSALSPKNIALMLAAGVAMNSSDLALTDKGLLIAVFVITASITIGIPVIYAVVEGEKAEARLNQSKNWLLENNACVVAAMLLFIGLFMIIKATSALLGVGA